MQARTYVVGSCEDGFVAETIRHRHSHGHQQSSNRRHMLQRRKHTDTHSPLQAGCAAAISSAMELCSREKTACSRETPTHEFLLLPVTMEPSGLWSSSPSAPALILPPSHVRVILRVSSSLP